MSVANSILLSDIRRMHEAGPAQIGARVSHDPSLLDEAAFQQRHGMSRADHAARERMYAREAFEAEHLGDLDNNPPACDVPAGLSVKRQAYARYHAWLRSEEQALANLENKKRDLQALIDAPAEAEGAIRAMVRRAADRLLNGLQSDESDAKARAELEAKHVAQRHQAQAAEMALPELERQIEVAQLRTERLQEREREFLYPVMHEVGEPLERLLARKRAEVAALERVLSPLFANYAYYGAVSVEPQHIEVRWKGSWSAIAEALENDAACDVSKLLPAVKFER